MFRRSRRGLAALGTAAVLIAGLVATAPAASSAGATFTWTGAAGPSWSSSSNWSPAGPPTAGDNVVFPPSSPTVNMSADLGLTTEVNVLFNGAGYTISAGALTLGPAGIVQSAAGLNQIVAPITVTATINQLPLTVASGGTLSIGGVVTGSLGIVKGGGGKLVLGGANTYSFGALVSAGSMIVNGTAPGITTVAGGALGGTGTTGAVTATAGGLSAGDAGPGLLTVNGNLALNTGVVANFDLTGTTAGTQFDQLRVVGGVALNNASLAVSGSFVGTNGSQFLIIDNQGAGAVVGTFAGLPEGQSFVATNGVSYKISYVGGNGNDVVLTQTGKGVTVLSGVDRVETAVNVSKNSFPAAGSTNAVVLARGDLFPDALAGSPLAVAKGGPLLLTSLVASTGIDVRTTAEIQRVLTPGKTIYILGGEVAISAAVATQLQGLGYTIVRLGGADRFDTAILIASTGLGNPTNILLATGLNFPDALAAGAAAAKVSGAVLLTNGTVQPPSNVSYLSAHPSDVLFALGGPATTAVPTAQSISGVDRYDTAVKVAQKFFTSPTTVGLASGVNFPDGLTGGAHIGRLGGPLVLTDPNALPAFTSAYLTSVAATVTSAFVYGGTNAISTNTVNAFRVAIGA